MKSLIKPAASSCPKTKKLEPVKNLDTSANSLSERAISASVFLTTSPLHLLFFFKERLRLDISETDTCEKSATKAMDASVEYSLMRSIVSCFCALVTRVLAPFYKGESGA
jgi:hypothetical protein